MPARVDTVGEESPGPAGGEVYPQSGSGETGMADRRGAASVAARPVPVRVLPAVGASFGQGLAHQRDCAGGGAAAVEQSATSIDDSASTLQSLVGLGDGPKSGPSAGSGGQDVALGPVPAFAG